MNGVAFRLKNEFCSRQFAGFLVVGGSAVILNFFCRVFLSGYLSYAAAIVVAYLIAMVFAFVLGKCFVFQSRRSSRTAREFINFGLVNGLAVLQTLGISLLLAYVVLPYCGVSSHGEEIAHAVGIMVPAFTSYVGHKHFTFK